MAKLHVDWLFIAIFTVGVIARIIGFGHQPAGTYWDETAILVDAKAIAQSGKDMHGNSPWQMIFPSYGDYKMPVLIWLAAASVALIGPSPFALRLPSMLAGIGTIMVAYYLAKKVWPNNKNIPYFAAAMVAISPWDIIFSHTAFEGHVAQFLLAAAALALLNAKKNWRAVIVAASLGALATYTYFSVRFVWPAVLAGMAIVLISQEWPNKQKNSAWILIKNLGLYLVTPLILYMSLLVPMIKSPLYADSNRFRLNADSILKSSDWPVVSNQWREWAGNTSVDRGIFHRHWLMTQALFQNYSDNLSASFLFLSGDPNLRHGSGNHGLFLAFLLPMLPLGLMVSWRKSWSVTLALVLWWLAALLPASVPENTPHALRSLNALVPLSLLLAVGCSAVWDWPGQISKERFPITPLVLRGTLLAVALFSLAEFLLYYTTIYQTKSYQGWQTDFDKTAVIINQYHHPNQLVLVEHNDDKFFLWQLLQIDFRQPPSQMAEKQYLFTQIGEFTFGQISPTMIIKNPQALVVTTEAKVAALTAALGKTPQVIAKTNDASGEYLLVNWQ